LPNTDEGRWTPEQLAYIEANPHGSHEEYREAGGTRSWNAWRLKRREVLGPGLPDARRTPRPLWQKPDTPEGLPAVEWDKQEADFSWRDLIKPGAELQAIAKRSSGSQDFATLHIDAGRPTPVVFLSDWHFGSWGTSLSDFERWTERLLAFPGYLAILGDMAQMSIILRSMIEVSDNMFTPQQQMKAIESWSEEMIPKVLWSTWDNHAVMREERLVGYSRYAEIWKEKVVYHSGIGHIDLGVGDQVYKLASSHRFRGNSYLNPTHGCMRYMRFEGIDREITIAGDSHRPAVQTYTDGPMPRCAVNCGSLQADSGYAKRHFSLFTHDWMPTVVFWPDRHLFHAYPSLDHFEAAQSSQSVSSVP
jgi:hypothetical protein